MRERESRLKAFKKKDDSRFELALDSGFVLDGEHLKDREVEVPYERTEKRDVCSKENDDRADCGIDRGNCLPVFERKFDCIWK